MQLSYKYLLTCLIMCISLDPNLLKNIQQVLMFEKISATLHRQGYILNLSKNTPKGSRWLGVDFI